ncbi:MAG TPA: PepSY domain-containing protein [Armatimonadota bacterium]|jgi:hypothetical protein
MKRGIKELAVLVAGLALTAGPGLAAPKATNAATPTNHTVSAAVARKAALAAVRGKASTPKLENEEGKMQYAVFVRHGSALYEVMVDAHTGKVTSKEKTSDAEERREAAAEARAKSGAHTTARHPAK